MNAIVHKSVFWRIWLAGLMVMSLVLANHAKGDATSDYTPSYLGERLGVSQKATTFPGLAVREKGGHKVGKLEEVVVDLHSGRVLCALVSIGKGETVAIPPRIFYSSDESESQLVLNDVSLEGVPRVKGTQDLMGSLPDTFKHFDRPIFWDAASPPAPHKCSDLIGLNVANGSGESLGRVANLMVDLPTGRVVFVLISLSGKAMDDLYAVPPKAFQFSENNGALLLKMSRDKVAEFAHSDGFFWSNMAEPAWGADVYRKFGERADFDPASTPANATVAHTTIEVTKPVPAKGDREIMQDILTAMMHDSTSDPLIFKHAQIKTVRGKVILTGRVKSEDQRSRLISVVAGVVGATNIDDQLAIK